MLKNLIIALEIMGKGMAGIFAAVVLLSIAVMIMSKLLGDRWDFIKKLHPTFLLCCRMKFPF